MANEWRIVRRAYAKYEQIATCDDWLTLMTIADHLEKTMKDGEYLVRHENEPDEGYPIQGYLKQSVSD